jgi:hypothetical protein
MVVADSAQVVLRMNCCRMRRGCQVPVMTLEQIQEQVGELTDEEFKAFCVWLENYKAHLWDRQLERDAVSGKTEAQPQGGEMQPP